MRLAPIITERLILRALTEDDFAVVYDILSDEVTTSRVSWRQTTPEGAHAWLVRRIRDERHYGLSMWALEERKSGEVIGLCGFFPREEPQLEIGYVVHARRWGNGFATEATAAALRKASEAGHRIYATIRPWNAASLRVAKKVGLQRTGSVTDERGELIVFGYGQ